MGSAFSKAGIDTPVAITEGGTGATTATQARTNLGIDLTALVNWAGQGTTLPDATTNSYKHYYKTDEDSLYISNGTSWLSLN